MMDSNYNILIGVSGCLQTYNILDFLSNLDHWRKTVSINGNHINVNLRLIVTKSTSEFIRTNNGIKIKLRQLRIEYFDDGEEWSKRSKLNDSVMHIQLRLWADILILAPLSANTMGKLAIGICDNLLTRVVRAWDTKKPLIFFPSMHRFMREHPVTAEHIDKLVSFNYIHIKGKPPQSPAQANTLYDFQEIPTPEIIENIHKFVNAKIENEKRARSMPAILKSCSSISATSSQTAKSGDFQNSSQSTINTRASTGKPEIKPETRTYPATETSRRKKRARAGKNLESNGTAMMTAVYLDLDAADLDADSSKKEFKTPENISVQPENVLNSDLESYRKRRRKSNPDGSDELPPIIARTNCTQPILSQHSSVTPVHTIPTGIQTTSATATGLSQIGYHIYAAKHSRSDVSRRPRVANIISSGNSLLTKNQSTEIEISNVMKTKSFSNFDQSASTGGNCDDSLDFDPSNLLEQTMITTDEQNKQSSSIKKNNIDSSISRGDDQNVEHQDRSPEKQISGDHSQIVEKETQSQHRVQDKEQSPKKNFEDFELVCTSNNTPLNSNSDSSSNSDDNLKESDGNPIATIIKSEEFMTILDINRFLALCFDESLQSYKCAICKHAIYKKKSSMQKHLNERHIQATSYQCQTCGIIFRRYDKLMRHQEQQHSNQEQSIC